MVIHGLIPLTHGERSSGVNGKSRYLVMVGDGDGEFYGISPHE